MNMLFTEGTFKLRGKEVSVAGQTLPVTEGYKVGVRGGYVTVDGTSVPGYPDRNIKVMVSSADSVTDTEASVTAAAEESDAEAVETVDALNVSSIFVGSDAGAGGGILIN